MPRFDKSPLTFRSSPLMEDAKDGSDIIDTNEIRVVGEDGRTMFAIRLGDDGNSIGIRGVLCSKVDGVIYDESLSILPLSSNVITVTRREYGKS